MEVEEQKLAWTGVGALEARRAHGLALLQRTDEDAGVWEILGQTIEPRELFLGSDQQRPEMNRPRPGRWQRRRDEGTLVSTEVDELARDLSLNARASMRRA